MATFLYWTFVLLVIPIAALSRPQKPANVLYIVIDDLRPEMHLAYNQSHMITPNFDRLAQRGLTFSRAYCQVHHTVVGQYFESNFNRGNTRKHNYIN